MGITMAGQSERMTLETTMDVRISPGAP